jgi:hypothetical protein
MGQVTVMERDTGRQTESKFGDRVRVVELIEALSDVTRKAVSGESLPKLAGSLDCVLDRSPEDQDLRALANNLEV